MIDTFTFITYWSWAVVFLVWLPGYFTSKKTSDIPNLRLQIPTSLLIFGSFAFLFNPLSFGLAMQITPHNLPFGVFGVALDIVSAAFAIWARLSLGNNWSGTVMTVKEGHTLTQTGPYAIVRHPIYTGLLFAFIGTALTVGTAGAYIGVVLLAIGLLIRVYVEERLMATQFGAEHAEYSKHTKKLIPFVW